jgi:methionine-S-sulfoxide reductase
VSDEALQTATFAGGCFWCTEHAFRGHDGVLGVVSGYTGGDRQRPTYEEVCSGRTGHVEAVQVRFDPGRIRYGELLEIFWRSIDPTDPGGQFADRGTQYRTVIFYHDEAQRAAAAASKKSLEESGRFERPVATEIRPAGAFFEAEAYHQEYSEKNPTRYRTYRIGSGRDHLLCRLWGDAQP